MTNTDGSGAERPNVMAVKVELVKEFLLDRIRDRVLERVDEELPTGTREALTRVSDLLGAAVPERLAREGYLTRVVEVEMFEPARRPIPWLAERVQIAGARGLADVAAELAREEPEAKPPPGPDAPASWRIPGPGGHVRHFLALMSAAALAREAREAVDEVALKRAWMFGFYVRCCEEALGGR